MIERLVFGKIYAMINGRNLSLKNGIYLGKSYSHLAHIILFKKEDDLYIKKFKNYNLENKSKLWINDFESEEININRFNLFEREYLHKLVKEKNYKNKNL